MWPMGPSAARGQTAADGNELLQDCTATLLAIDAGQIGTTVGWCRGYVLGFTDGYNFALHPSRTNKPSSAEFCTRGTPTDQMVRVLVAWLHRHPNLLHLSRDTLTWAAFVEVFPCSSAFAPPQEQTPQLCLVRPHQKPGKETHRRSTAHVTRVSQLW